MPGEDSKVISISKGTRPLAFCHPVGFELGTQIYKISYHKKCMTGFHNPMELGKELKDNQ